MIEKGRPDGTSNQHNYRDKDLNLKQMHQSYYNSKPDIVNLEIENRQDLGIINIDNNNNKNKWHSNRG